MAAVLVLAVAGLSLGTNPSQQPKHHKGAVKKNRPPQPRAFDDRRGNSNWPYGPGYNFPYPDRPYGDPGHGGE
jgi:hypothetical protein